MISASKYLHIIYFKSLLKVSLCINRPKQRLVCMDTRRGCRSKRSLTPWKNKKQFFFYCMGGLFAIFFYGRALCYVFLFMGVFFSLYGGLFVTFFLRGGPFCYVFLLACGFFHYVGAFFVIFSPFVGTFCLHGGFYVFMGFF